MINQERVREMTHMAVLESGIGEKELNISTYRKADYILLSLVRGVAAGTVCFASVLGIWFFWHWDTLNQYFADADFAGFLREWLVYYLIFMGMYLVLCGVVAGWRHNVCLRRRKLYLKYLHQLNQSYSAEE